MTLRADTIEPRFSGDPAPGWRALGWALLGTLAAFLVNNILVIGFGGAHLSSLFTEGLGAAWVPLAVYAIFMGAGVAFAISSSDTV